MPISRLILLLSGVMLAAALTIAVAWLLTGGALSYWMAAIPLLIAVIVRAAFLRT